MLNQSSKSSEAKILPEDKHHKPQILLAVVILLSVGMMVTSFVLYNRQQRQTANLKPFASIRQRVNFTVYYPTKLPTGFRVDENSVSIANQVVTFSAISQKTQPIFFSIQPIPKEHVSFDAFEKNFKQTQSIDTAYGKGISGQLGGVWTVSLRLDSWVLIRSTDSSQRPYLSEVAKSLKPLY